MHRSVLQFCPTWQHLCYTNTQSIYRKQCTITPGVYTGINVALTPGVSTGTSLTITSGVYTGTSVIIISSVYTGAVMSQPYPQYIQERAANSLVYTHTYISVSCKCAVARPLLREPFTMPTRDTVARSFQI